MSNKRDVKHLLGKIDLVSVMQAYGVTFQQNGREFEACCPWHAEDTPSFKINPTKFPEKGTCFGACATSKNALDFLIEIEGMEFKAAFDLLDNSNFTRQAAEGARSTRPRQPVKFILDPGTTPPAPIHYADGKPDQVWEYREESGAPMFLSCRWNKSGGKKEFRPFSLTDKGWRFLKPSQPCPIYGLEKLPKFKNVAIFEGEKDADAGQALMDSACLSWCGGSAGVMTADWSPIFGRNVLLVRDNDEPGHKCMSWLGDHLAANGCRVYWLEPMENKPKGWDVADENWKVSNFQDWKKTIVKFADRPEFIESAKPTKAVAAVVGALGEGPTIKDTKPDDGAPFAILGFEKTDDGGEKYWFYCRASKITLAYKPTQLSKLNMMSIAPLDYWMARFGDKAWETSAADWIINTAHAMKPFSNSFIRGRGACLDKNRVVIHLGDRLLVDGMVTELDRHASRYRYEAGEELLEGEFTPLANQESIKYLDICKRMNWERSVNAYLFAGWVVVAPICGALDWRPHMWLTGSSGTGKSTILKDLAFRMTSGIGLYFEGGTTEAAVRQSLRQDRFPVIFDEGEADTRKAAINLENIIQLVRSNSTDNGAIIAKGGATGTVQKYSLSSMFLFASIGVEVTKTADLSRITVLGLARNHGADASQHWKETQAMIANTLTDTYARSLVWRTISILPNILQNGRTFSEVIKTEMGNERSGDQLGILLAGAYALKSRGLISVEDAKAFISAQDWSDERANLEVSDEAELVEYILDLTIRFANPYGGIKERTVSELIVAANGDDENMSKEVADEVLQRHGMKVADGFWWISTKSQFIIENLVERGGIGGKKFARIIERFPGADNNPNEKGEAKSTYLAKSTHRVVRLPLANFKY